MPRVLESLKLLATNVRKTQNGFPAWKSATDEVFTPNQIQEAKRLLELAKRSANE